MISPILSVITLWGCVSLISTMKKHSQPWKLGIPLAFLSFTGAVFFFFQFIRLQFSLSWPLYLYNVLVINLVCLFLPLAALILLFAIQKMVEPRSIVTTITITIIICFLAMILLLYYAADSIMPVFDSGFVMTEIWDYHMLKWVWIVGLYNAICLSIIGVLIFLLSDLFRNAGSPEDSHD
jgi:hypothetical protein